ncbi:MAG: calcium-binding protein, partial [Methylococcaceae bacterium]|nr:calcium-binding protein [Methylococcaceae bacterium]
DVTLLGDGGNDLFKGDDGNDAIYPGPGRDTVHGGTGTDAVAYVDLNKPVTIDLAAGYADESNGDRDTIDGIENVLGGADDDHIYGDARANVLDGWDGDDVIQGKGGIDDLRGGDGNDLLDGGDDKDTILDGEGNDTLVGGSGDDALLADTGDDILEGGPDDDLISGGSGSDTASYASATHWVLISLKYAEAPQNTQGAGMDELWSIENLTGTAYTDWLYGDGFANILEGGEGNDHLSGEGDNDTLSGGVGDDILFGGEGVDEASYRSATGAITANLSAGTANGADGNDTLGDIEDLSGSNYGDTLIGDDADNKLMGNGGDDVLRGGQGDDTVDGGSGTDTASWLLSSAAVVVNLASGVATGEGGTDLLVSIENVEGSDGYGDTLTGNGLSNRLEGKGGDDVLRSGLGDDTLRLGDDTLSGGSGFDTATYAEAGARVTVDLATGTAISSEGSDTLKSIEAVIGSGYGDSLFGFDGAESLEGREGDDIVSGGGGNDTLTGGQGSDWVSYFFAPGSITVDLASGAATGADGTDTLAGFEKVIGSSTYGDTLSGDAGDNILQGWGGDDLLRGGAGSDTLDGGAGQDCAAWEGANGSVTVNLATGTAAGAAGSDVLIAIEDITGSSSFGDTLTGDGNVNVIEGRGGDDVIEGAGGDDVLDGGAGVDSVSYRDAASFVYVDLTVGQSEFGAGVDQLSGFENVIGSENWDDGLIGDAAGNEIDGLGGADAIVGSGGADELRGGLGKDTFIYGGTSDADAAFGLTEEIEDFTSGVDKISLVNIDTDPVLAGDQGFAFIGSDAFSGGGVAQVRFSAGVVYADSNGDGTADMAIALTGVNSVMATDFLL